MRTYQFSPRRSSRRAPQLLVGTVLAALVLAACGGSDDSGQSGDVMRVGSDLTYPPYAYLDDEGEPAGFDAEMVRALADEIGMQPEFQDTRFEQLIPNLNSGQFDLIASALYITADRAKEVDYIPYFTTGNSIVSPTDAAETLALVSDLCGKTVGVIKGAAVADSMRQEANGECQGSDPIDVREFPTDPEATQALLSGQVDAEVTDAAVAKVAVDKTSGELEITSDELLYPIPVGLAVELGNDALEKQIRDALDKLRASGKYQELLDKYNLQAPDQAEVDKILGG